MDSINQEPEIEEVVASAPPPIDTVVETSEPIKKPDEEIPAETVEFSREKVINNLKPQENKYWRFSFKNENHTKLLENTIKQIPELNLTVNFEMKQNTPDITIKQGDSEVGKINLLLCDRRDANLPEKYYCKVYFYHFKDQQIYQAVKAAVVNFFDNLKSFNTPLKDIGGKRNKHRTYKKKRIVRRKKTSKRKQRK
jgi:hypothetical protein